MWSTAPLATDPPDFIRWTSRITKAQTFTVLPDGCRDILIRETATGTQITLTALDLQPRQIMLLPGDRMTGYRLRPGLQIDPSNLTETSIPDAISHASRKQTDLSAAIAALGNNNTPAQTIARQLGVSLRTLQRHLAKRNLPPPDFWRLLGRARRAAIALGAETPLADIAGLYGYSDQSHMTRACRYWFGHSPRQIRQSTTIQSDINQPALGTWRR